MLAKCPPYESGGEHGFEAADEGFDEKQLREVLTKNSTESGELGKSAYKQLYSIRAVTTSSAVWQEAHVQRPKEDSIRLFFPTARRLKWITRKRAFGPAQRKPFKVLFVASFSNLN